MKARKEQNFKIEKSKKVYLLSRRKGLIRYDYTMT
jgi:hypothetical protein